MKEFDVDRYRLVDRVTGLRVERVTSHLMVEYLFLLQKKEDLDSEIYQLKGVIADRINNGECDEEI